MSEEKPLYIQRLEEVLGVRAEVAEEVAELLSGDIEERHAHQFGHPDTNKIVIGHIEMESNRRLEERHRDRRRAEILGR